MGISGATYKETREVVDGSGKKFTCKYSLFYNSKTVTKSRSSVTCTPNTKGKPVSQEFVIESLGKTATVNHSIKKGREVISSVTVKDYVPPPPTSTSGEAMDCTCKLPGMGNTELGRSGFQYKINKKEGSDRGRGGGYGGHHGGYHGHGHGHGVSTGGSSILSTLIPLALGAILAGLVAAGGTALLSQLFTTVVSVVAGRLLGRSLPLDDQAESEDFQARLLAKLNDLTNFEKLGNEELNRGRGGGGHHGGYHGGHHGGYHGGHGVSTGGSSILSTLIPLALGAILAGLVAAGGTALLSTLFTTIVSVVAGRLLGRSLLLDDQAESEDFQARLLAKLNDRQLLGNLGNFGAGNLGNLGNFGNGNLGNLGNLGN